MATTNISSSFFFVYLFMLLACTSFGVSATKLGGYWPIRNKKDTTAVAAAKFAVAEHNKQAKTFLKFVKIVDGLEEAVAGMNYKLVILAKDGTTSKYYEVYLYDGLWLKYRALYFFNRIRFVPGGPHVPPPALFVGAYEPIENHDPLVVAAAKSSVAHHNKQAKTSLKFIRVVNGKAQVDIDVNYKLVISAKDGSIHHYYEVFVSVDREKNNNGKVTTLHSFKRVRSGGEDTIAPTPSTI